MHCQIHLSLRSKLLHVFSSVLSAHTNKRCQRICVCLSVCAQNKITSSPLSGLLPPFPHHFGFHHWTTTVTRKHSHSPVTVVSCLARAARVLTETRKRKDMSWSPYPPADPVLGKMFCFVFCSLSLLCRGGADYRLPPLAHAPASNLHTCC